MGRRGEVPGEEEAEEEWSLAVRMLAGTVAGRRTKPAPDATWRGTVGPFVSTRTGISTIRSAAHPARRTPSRSTRPAPGPHSSRPVPPPRSCRSRRSATATALARVAHPVLTELRSAAQNDGLNR
uniref:(northern house mosquito) hypothetical protein n=1 Tax=Culex pipiens TaxID=7175 RepID=A0A8D8FAW3_CULPI